MGCPCRDTTLVSVIIPADLSHTGQEHKAVKPIDRCISNLVIALNEAGVQTRGSCCGHGGIGEIILSDGYIMKLHVVPKNIEI